MQTNLLNGLNKVLIDEFALLNKVIIRYKKYSFVVIVKNWMQQPFHMEKEKFWIAVLAIMRQCTSVIDRQTDTDNVA